MARFAIEGNKTDVLQNTVHLPDGRMVNGNRIVRGDTAKEIVTNQVAHMVRERGKEVVRQIDTEVDNTILCINGTAADRRTIFSAAMDLLSSQTPGQTDDNTLANIAYLLYQAPLTKRGSDAVIRTYIVAAGTFLTGTPPFLPQDVDLRAYVMGQQKFIDYFTTHSA